MGIEAIRENLEYSREGLPYLMPTDGSILLAPTNGEVDDQGYTKVLPNAHEEKLYSICEGLIVEVERLQERLDTAETHTHTYFDEDNDGHETWGPSS